MGSLSVTGRAMYRQPFEPLVPGVAFLPFDNIDALEAIDESVACVIAEPIQGEGGVRVPSDNWMRALRHRCDKTEQAPPDTPSPSSTRFRRASDERVHSLRSSTRVLFPTC